MGGKAYEAFGRYTRVHTRRFGESFKRRNARFCGCGESLGRHREGRTPARFFLWTWALLALAFLVTPAYAVVDYSEMGIAWGPTTVDASTSPRQVGEILVTNSKNNAAVLVVGGNLLDSRLTHDVMAKLSNEGTGGAFYELTQLVHRYYATDGEYEYPNWANWGQFDTLANVYGRDYIFWIQCTEAQIASAKEDYNAVLNGAELGGGSGGGGSGSDVPDTIHVTMDDWIAPDTNKYYGLRPQQPLSLTMDIDITKIKTAISSYVEDYDHIYFLVWRNGSGIYGSGYLPSIDVFLTDSVVTNSNYVYTFTAPVRYNFQVDCTGTMQNNANNALGTGNVKNNTNHFSSTTNQTSDVTTQAAWLVDAKGGSSTPVLPPNNWPDNPVVTTPEPPDVPTDTPVYPPQVTGPDVTVPQTPDLSDVLDALNEHCIHLQDAIYNGFNDYYETITSYYSDVVEWLQDWFEYFDEQLDSYFRQDIGIGKLANQWLSQIYNKLDDIDAKLDGLGGKLESNDIPSSYDDSNVATDGSSVLVGAYNNLRTKFPFSLLDSLANFATLLKHQAVAPDFDLPVGSPFGSHDPFTVEIDLTPYSDWAAIVRTGEVLAVYIALARRAAAMWTREGEGA